MRCGRDLKNEDVLLQAMLACIARQEIIHLQPLKIQESQKLPFGLVWQYQLLKILFPESIANEPRNMISNNVVF